MRLRTCAVAAAAVVSLACFSVTPPKADVQRTGTEVNASVGRTWDAVVRQFAEDNIPIRTMERSSGYISTDNLLVSDRVPNATRYDCGKDPNKMPMPATGVVYNALVRGDSTHSTVKVTARWVSVQPAARVEFMSTSMAPVSVPCTTQGGWESYFESVVKIGAEAK